MIALTISLGELTTSAAILPAGAAFGGSLSLENTGNTDLLKLGYPANQNATSASAFPNQNPPSDDDQDNVTVSIAPDSFYHFRLSYDQATQDLAFRIWGGDATQAAAANFAGDADGSEQGQVLESDVYQALLDAKGAAFAQQTGNLTALAFGFYAPTDYRIELSSLTLSGAAFVPSVSSLSFQGGAGINGVSDFLNGYVLPATGLTDGFVLDGVFQAIYTGGGTVSQSSKLGFEVYAVVPEPATVAFGLALVGGLGLMEVRRRKKA